MRLHSLAKFIVICIVGVACATNYVRTLAPEDTVIVALATANAFSMYINCVNSKLKISVDHLHNFGRFQSVVTINDFRSAQIISIHTDLSEQSKKDVKSAVLKCNQKYDSKPFNKSSDSISTFYVEGSFPWPKKIHIKEVTGALDEELNFEISPKKIHSKVEGKTL